MTVDELLSVARAGLRRLTATQAWEAARDGDASIVDIRPAFQRARDGEIPDAIVIERVHLEWRLDPACPARIPEAVDHQVRWIVLCDEGYSSSLAAASLQAIGLRNATDVVDGFRAWRAAGLPTIHPGEPTAPRLYISPDPPPPVQPPALSGGARASACNSAEP